MSDFSKEECKFVHSDFCTNNAGEDCAKCELSKLKGEKLEEMTEKLAFTRGLLPPEGLGELCTDECKFCKQDPPRAKELYALSDLAHPEPKGTKPSAVGIKVKTTIGSLVPVQFSCCKRCASNFRMADILCWLTTLLMVALTIVVLAIPAVGSALGFQGGISAPAPGTVIEDGGELSSGLLPIAILVAMAIAGYYLGKLVEKAYRKAKSSQTEFNIGAIPMISRLYEMGWFPAFSSGNQPRLLFSKKKRPSLLD